MKNKAVQGLLIGLNIVAALAVIAIAVKILIVPAVAKYVYRDDYKRLVFECDEVMRGHLIAKNQVTAAPSEEAVKNLRAAEVCCRVTTTTG